MSKVRIDGKEHAIGKIFSDEFEFSIPRYQRPYSWAAEKAEALFNDLLTSALEDERKDIQEIDPYFLGCIVLIKEPNQSNSAIVDGQQRLTTITILLSALRASLPKDTADNLVTYLYQKGNEIAGTPNRYRLSLRERDDDFFKKYIQDESGIDKLANLSDRELTDSQKLIKENALLFLNRLRGNGEERENPSLNLFSESFDEYSLSYSQSLSESQRLRLAKFIIQQCFLVVVSTPNLETAYRIFSVLNDRGFNISLTDILKAEVIGKITEKQQHKYTRKWEDIEDQLGRENFSELFSHIRTIYRKTIKPGKNILEEFRDYVLKPINNPQTFIEYTLCPYASAFYKILKPNDDTNQLSIQLKKLFQWLNQIDNFDWVPPAIAFLADPNRDYQTVVDFFIALERLAAGLMLLRANVNKRLKRYRELLNAIESKSYLFNPNSPLQLTPEEQNELIKILDGDLYLMEKIRRYVLLRLDSELSDGGALYNHDIITVEHVLPQNPAPESEWSRIFPNKKEREKLYLHRLGNLVLLTRSTNSKAQNLDFKLKKQCYFTTDNGISPFVLTTQVLSEENWTPSIILKRQELLLNKLKKTWRLQNPSPVIQMSLWD